MPFYRYFPCRRICADDGFYSGTSLGHTSVGNPTTDHLTKSSDAVFGGFFGYRLNQNFGVEGAYMGIGRYRNTTQSGKADALSLALVGFVPITEHVELIGKLGVADAFGRASTGGLSNTNRLAPMAGIGVQYNPTKRSDFVSESIATRRGQGGIGVPSLQLQRHCRNLHLPLLIIEAENPRLRRIRSIRRSFGDPPHFAQPFPGDTQSRFSRQPLWLSAKAPRTGVFSVR